MWVFWVNILVDILLSITFVLAIAHYGTHGWGNDGTEVGVYSRAAIYCLSQVAIVGSVVLALLMCVQLLKAMD